MQPKPLSETTARIKSLLIGEVTRVQGLMRLLMKRRNGEPWSAEDRAELQRQLRHLAKTLPALGIFALPGGGLLLPLLAYFLDRRRSKRLGKSGACDG